MRYQIYEAKSVKYDAQQRVGVSAKNPESIALQCFQDFFFRFDPILTARLIPTISKNYTLLHEK